MNAKYLLFLKSSMAEILKEITRYHSYKHDSYRLVNNNRYAIVVGREGYPNIAVTLKKEVFFNFGKMFYHLGETGVGDSINCEELKMFKALDVKMIYTKFRNGKLYCISLDDFLNNSIKWQQKEGTWVRSISIHEYKRVNP